MDKNLYLGVDIGGTNIRLGLVDEDYQLTHFVRRSSLNLQGEDGIAVLTRMMRDYLEKTGTKDQVAAAAVGIPGQVSKDHNFVYTVTMLPGLQDRPLGEILERELGIPVFIEHDVEPMLTYDITTMCLDQERKKTILGCYIGTGYGNALYLNGKMFTGAHGVAGELGHIPLYGVEDLCYCGAVGCVESRACGRYLADLVERDFPDCTVGEIFTKHGDDPRIIKFVKDCALPIATEITLLDPDLVILGGGVITTPNFPTDLFEAEIRSRAKHPLPADDVRFIYTVDAQTNGVMGGGISAMELMKERESAEA